MTHYHSHKATNTNVFSKHHLFPRTVPKFVTRAQTRHYFIVQQRLQVPYTDAESSVGMEKGKRHRTPCTSDGNGKWV